MNLRQYDAFCKKLPATTTVIQWGDAHVWKVGGKVFAIGREDEDGFSTSFKVSDLAFEILSEQPGCRPAPYLASRGLKWIQRYDDAGVDDAALKDYLREAHRLIALNLTKRLRRELGFDEDAATLARRKTARPKTARSTKPKRKKATPARS